MLILCVTLLNTVLLSFTQEILIDPVSMKHGVRLSAQDSGTKEYLGRLWRDNTIILMEPQLAAYTVKGISKSGKVCGFELRGLDNQQVNDFTAYLIDEKSGLGEMQVTPDANISWTHESVIKFKLEAFDCDLVRHYSTGVPVSVFVFPQRGPRFSQQRWLFTVQKDSPIGTVVGEVSAISTNGGGVHYSLYNSAGTPFAINAAGMILTTSSLENTSASSFQIRVLAKEVVKSIVRHAIAEVTVEIEPICNNQLTGIPDQFDYNVRTSLSSIIEYGQLVQQQHKPTVVICQLSSPVANVEFRISIGSSPLQIKSSNSLKLCPENIPSIRIQRSICGANPKTLDLFVARGGSTVSNIKLVNMPERVANFNNEFTLSWWMKRNNFKRQTLFCIKDEGSPNSFAITIENCRLLLMAFPQNETSQIDIPFEFCRQNEWQLYTITRQMSDPPVVMASVGNYFSRPAVSTSSNLFLSPATKIHIGDCQPMQPNVVTTENPINIGAVWISSDRTEKKEVSECLSFCGEVLTVIDSKTKKANIERHGSSIHLKSSNISSVIESLLNVAYVNTFYIMHLETKSKFEAREINFDLTASLSADSIKIPRAIMKVNFIDSMWDSAGNDTVDVDIIVNSTVITEQHRSIPIFANLQFAASNGDGHIAKGFKIESCSVRPLQRYFLGREKVRLTPEATILVKENNLRVISYTNSWNIEGESKTTLYENILRNLLLDTAEERRKITVICATKNGDLTNQAIVEVIKLRNNKVTFVNEVESDDIEHNFKSERKQFDEKSESRLADLMNISKPKFVAVIIMAIFGGAAWALVSAAIACFLIKRKYSKVTGNRKRHDNENIMMKNIVINHQNEMVDQSLPVNLYIDCDCEEDRLSMADIPNMDEHSVDNLSCDICNINDNELYSTLAKTVKDMPRSKTVNFPITLRRF